jgi:hypothetical protein
MIVISQWAGLATNASPYSLPPGAAVTQVNLQVLTPGQIVTRPGHVAVTWQSHTGSTAPIVSAFRYPSPANETVVYQNSLGAIFIAKGPT